MSTHESNLLTDQSFPIIRYVEGKTHLQWGTSHGEEFRQAIKELAAIRKELMLNKNPALLKNLDALADQQWKATERFSPALASEMLGISQGSNLSKTDILILNNYTDFRDIIPEQGCSTVAVKSNDKMFVGQTWDMHRSAKNYMCCIVIPETEEKKGQVILSLTGCLGIMGVSQNGLFIGVNNINTKDAKPGIVWPALVRKSLESKDFQEMVQTAKTAPVTSGHNYMMADQSEAQHWEITPNIKALVSSIAKNEKEGQAFHTNHCLAEATKNVEDAKSLSSTTFTRMDTLEKNLPAVSNFWSLIGLLTGHTDYPKGICSHFESGTQDPSFTCGGGVYDFSDKIVALWRGCPLYDENFKYYEFDLQNLKMIKNIPRSK